MLLLLQCHAHLLLLFGRHLLHLFLVHHLALHHVLLVLPLCYLVVDSIVLPVNVAVVLVAGGAWLLVVHGLLVLFFVHFSFNL